MPVANCGVKSQSHATRTIDDCVMQALFGFMHPLLQYSCIGETIIYHYWSVCTRRLYSAFSLFFWTEIESLV